MKIQFDYRLYTRKILNLIRTLWKSAQIITRKGVVQFLFIAIIIAFFHITFFVTPTIQWIPGTIEADSFIKLIWQIHASIIGITVVIVTIIVTVIANERDRTRTWYLYADNSKFIYIIWFNLIAILSEGAAVIQTYRAANPIFPSDDCGNLILFESILFIFSIILAAWLFTITLKFLDDDYVEDLAEKQIVRLIPDAVKGDIQRIVAISDRIRRQADGH